MDKFFTSEKELKDDIAKLQRNFSELNDELRRVAKTTLPYLLLMSRIMSTLPSEYFEFKSVWDSIPIEARSVNKLTERLRRIEMRLPSKSTDSTALVATRKKVFKKPERKCYVCRKPGHLAKDCWKKGSKPKVEGDAFVCTVEDVPESEVWITDNGASAHMTKHKHYFVVITKFVSPKPSKNEVSKCLETFLNEARSAGHMVKEVLSNGGGEVTNSTVKSVLEKSGISSLKKPLQTPEPDVEKEIEEISCNAEDTEETLVQQSSRNLRDRSILKMPAKFDSFVQLAEHMEHETYKEAMAFEDSDKWLAAMKKELESVSNNNTLILVNLPSDRKAIDNRWVFW
ncbi:retrovirus-related Pol polyprotein from transposon TNT 1-94 [Trichonephila clavata]|uniref:Retrovirus-related Pol polyprotein from transposon TNT 1-94 n=1 Tax=Trichonephila clavata TaxID=2740835 RepID=A0A8X6JJS8_TRICU|nr:retrovirus-related Pol polyprotein from transposon TNT 1-94 [Trichonephila clavata]